MRARISPVTMLAAALALSTPTWAQTNLFGVSGFSATVNLALPTGGAMSMRIYVLGTSERTDLPGGRGGYSLTIGSNQTMYLVMNPSMCMQRSLDLQKNGPNPFTMSGDVKRQEVGTETVDGHPTKVELITLTTHSGPMTMKAWRATDLQGFPVRLEIPMPNGGTMREELTDVNLSPPPSSMFAPPSNCMQMGAMPGMPGAPH
ncbi:MAG TPA: hypothetical protein VMU40_03270 [Steroidobacteraceae bacterium]|nr:hypothetical protein [Steroidobacteraceae bacterium]